MTHNTIGQTINCWYLLPKFCRFSSVHGPKAKRGGERRGVGLGVEHVAALLYAFDSINFWGQHWGHVTIYQTITYNIKRGFVAVTILMPTGSAWPLELMILKIGFMGLAPAEHGLAQLNVPLSTWGHGPILCFMIVRCPLLELNSNEFGVQGLLASPFQITSWA